MLGGTCSRSLHLDGALFLESPPQSSFVSLRYGWTEVKITNFGPPILAPTFTFRPPKSRVASKVVDRHDVAVPILAGGKGKQRETNQRRRTKRPALKNLLSFASGAT